MKKSLFLVAATASLLLASCSNDELVEVPGQSAIGFDAFVGKTTRATDATTSSLKRITVNGYIGGATPVKTFENQWVTRADVNQPWDYEPKQYWTAGKAYFFTAVASPALAGQNHYDYEWPADGTELPSATAGFNGIGTITFDNAAAAGNEDVVYAPATKTTADPLTSTPGEVEFSFKHALSRVIVTFENAMGSAAYTIEINNLSLKNATGQANLVLGDANPVWSGHANTTTLEFRPGLFAPTNRQAANNGKVQSGSKFIIPGTLNNLKISFDVNVIVNGGLIATYHHVDKALPETAFENGHSYNFVATLTPDNIDPDNQMFPIEFNVVNVEGWTLVEPDINIPYEENTPTPEP